MASYSFRQFLRDVIYFLPLVIITVLFAVRNSSWWTYMAFVTEDGILPRIQFFLYLISGLCTVYLSFSLLCVGSLLISLFYFILTLVSLLVAIMKVPWPQVVLNQLLPELWPQIIAWLSQIGIKPGESSPIIPSVYVALGILIILSRYLMPNWFKESAHDEIRLLVPGLYLSFYFVPIVIFFFYLDFINLKILLYYNYWLLSWQDQEVFKFTFALGFFFFVVRNTCSGFFARAQLSEKKQTKKFSGPTGPFNKWER